MKLHSFLYFNRVSFFNDHAQAVPNPFVFHRTQEKLTDHGEENNQAQTNNLHSSEDDDR